MARRRTVETALMALVLVPAAAWAAGQITGVVANPSTTYVNKPVTVTVQGTGTCSQVVVRCQAPAAPEHVKTNVALPFGVTCTYAATGAKTVTASAELPRPDCPGDKIAQVTVQLGDPGVFAPAGDQPGLKPVGPTVFKMKPTFVSVDVEPHGTFAVFKFKASEKVKRWITLHDTPPSQVPNAPLPPTLVGNPTAPFDWKTDWEDTMMPLAPGKTFFYRILIVDTDSNEVKTYGSFTTKNRLAKVTFEKIEMVDDSDDWSDCDCGFGFTVAGMPMVTYSGDVSSGTTVHPNKTISVPSAPSSERQCERLRQR